MRTRKGLAFGLLFVLFLGFTGEAFSQKPYKELRYPKLREIKIPKVDKVVLKNGMKVFLLEDHELPLISASARIRVGSVYEPPDKVGLAQITGEVMRTGGTSRMPGDKIDEALESMAASIETSIGLEAGYASLSVLKEDVDTVLAIFADILMNPAFPEDKIELAKIQLRSAIARRNDDVNQIANREFMKLIYGATSPYARHPEYATVDAIQRQDLVEFHKKYFHPNNVILAVWGDFKKKEMIRKLERVFARWEPAKITFPEVPEVEYEFKPTVNLIRKTDVNQTNIILGHIGGTLDNPDYFALVVLNRILGHGFTSRLFRNVRSRMGLAYSVFGTYSANYTYPGVFYVGCQTKSQSTVKAIRAMIHEIRRITQEKVTQEELELAKASYLNSFVFNFDSRGKIIRRMLTYEFYGYPLDFLQRIKKGVERVTVDDIYRVARKYLRPDALQILAVGNPDEFDEPLSVFGPVNEIDITIPVPEEKAPEASAGALEKGRLLLRKVVEAAGGKEALASIRSVARKATLAMETPQGSMEMKVESYVLYPDKLAQTIQTPMGKMKQVLAGDTAWMQGPQGSMDLPEAQRQNMKKELARDYLHLLQLAAEGKLKAQYLGKETHNGKEVEGLRLEHEAFGSLQMYVDPETYLPAKISYKTVTMQGPARVENVYLEWMRVNQLQFPKKTVGYANGKKVTTVTVEEIQVNVAIPDSLFERESK